jgi:acyl dehydratase
VPALPIPDRKAIMKPQRTGRTTLTTITNYTYDEIEIGQMATYSRTITQREITLFAAASGDVNPLHLDAAYAATTPFEEPIAHGILSASLISAAIAMKLPGPGVVYVGQSLRFLRPVKAGDTLNARIEVTAKRDDKKFVTLNCEIVNQHAKPVVTGEALVLAPSEKVTIDTPELPAISVGELRL